MNNQELTSVLEVAVLAIAQALTIILTIRRERDVNDLRELVEQQRLRLAELRAWLAGRNSSHTRIASERKSQPGPTANVSELESEIPQRLTEQPHTPEDVARATRALEWQRDVTARLQSGGIKETLAAEQATTPAVEDGFKWFKDDPSEPREIVEARAIVTGLRKTNHPQAQGYPESSTIRPGSNAGDELDRINRAVSRLKEGLDSSEITGLNRKSSVGLK